jgi:hypothetical protein
MRPAGLSTPKAIICKGAARRTRFGGSFLCHSFAERQRAFKQAAATGTKTFDAQLIKARQEREAGPPQEYFQPVAEIQAGAGATMSDFFGWPSTVRRDDAEFLKNPLASVEDFFKA